MQMGGEYESDKIGPQQMEQLAEDAGLARPMVKKRVPELASLVIAGLDKVDIQHPVADKVAEIIKARCERTISKF